MKTFLLALTLSALSICLSSAQNQLDIHAGFSPAQNIGSQEIRVSNSEGLNNSALSPSRQSAGVTAGIGFTHTLESGFFLRSELQYRYSNTSYSMRDIQESSERIATYDLDETSHTLAIPLSVGVRLGSFRAMSGVNVNALVHCATSFEHMANFTDSSPSIYLGWHASLSYDIGKIGLEVRYSNDFKNFAQGYTIGDKELIFYGNRTRWTMLVKYYLGAG